MMPAERILLNAEPFGFGPAAAIAAIARSLLERGCILGYIGQGHTLDLQRSIDYSERYDLTALVADARRDAWKRAAKQFDVFVTAMDFQAAEEARLAGMRVIIYDALTWYWPELPPIVKSADLYLAQNFFGVENRLNADVRPYTRAELVPPLTASGEGTAEREHILVNLGGLQNPEWSLHDAVQYARCMVRGIRAALAGENLIIATSRLVAEALADPDIRTYDQAYMQNLLAHSSLAIMTPGLGNIYDAASYDVPTLWLPPANDSQGRQLELIRRHGYCDAAVNWEDLGLSIAMDAPQPSVLAAITSGVNRLQNKSGSTDRLQAAIRHGINRIDPSTDSRTAGLLQVFGSGGAEIVAAKIVSFVQEYQHVHVQ